MKCFVGVSQKNHDLFRESSGRLAFNAARDSMVLVLGRAQFNKLMNREENVLTEKSRLLLEHGTVVWRTSPATDFLIEISPNGKPTYIDEIAESEAFEEIIDLRQAPPFLKGENSAQAFKRIFGYLLSNSVEWQVIDRFLLEQLVKRQQTFQLLMENIELLPDSVEIYSQNPFLRSTNNGPPLQENRETQTSLEALNRAFESVHKKLSIFGYSKKSPHAKGFPHPRVQLIMFDRGEFFSTLDDGLQSLTKTGDLVQFSRSSSKVWLEAKEIMHGMDCRKFL
jgi:hypothetical protein